jgi:hypothetical protein
MTAFIALLLLLSVCLNIQPHSWWYIIVLISLIMLSQLIYLWYIRKSVGFQEELQDVPVLSQSQTFNFVQKLNSSSTVDYPAIPTGILIEYAQFSKKGSDIYPGIYLNGYIWQRYNLTKHANLERDFIIPNASTLIKQELYRGKENDEEIICWSFKCGLYQSFNPSLYPFDHRHITLSLMHKNFEKNVTLIPDLTAYDIINPLELPGISLESFMIPSWKILKSFFNLDTNNFRANLGSPTFVHKTVPQLQFLFTAERKLNGDFLMHFLLLATVLVIVFILLLAFLKQEALIELVGFSTLSVLGACSGLLFVLIMSEIDLRQTLMTEGVVYLEYFYFVCYFAIIGVIIDSILFAVKGNIRLITYENNLIFKLLYWPSVLLFLVLITAYTFY